jgi:outer membrane protein TolC
MAMAVSFVSSVAHTAGAAPPPAPPLPAPAPAAPAASAPSPPVVAPPTVAAPGGPMSLQQAVQLTLARNEHAKISDLNVVVADAAVEKARAGFLPVLSALGQDTQHSNSNVDNVANGSVTVNQPVVNASAYPLYSQAKRLAEAQGHQNVDDRRLLGFTAATAFFSVLNAQDVVTAAMHQNENAKANLADTQARAESGLVSSNDATRARLDETASARELENDKGTLDNAYVQLGFTTNSPVPSVVVPPQETLAAAQRPPGGPEQLVKIALDHRPDVQVAKLQAVAAHDGATEPLLRIVPTLGVQGQATATTNSPAPGRWHDETIQATLNWTLYDAGMRYADKHSRDAQADIADLNTQLLLRNVDAQVRSAVAVLTASQAAFRVASGAVKLAQQNVEETAILYRQGLAKAIELVDANDSRFTAEVNYASAEFTMAQAYLGLRQALGLDALGTELR